MEDHPLIDSHAHVWDRTCHMVPGARYHPDDEATIGAYLRVLDAHGIAKAVLVQPSFLGTDNSYLLACLQAYPDRLRGIVVLDPRVSGVEVEDLTAQGVIGHRLNLIGRDPGVASTRVTRELISRTTARGWWTEVQAKGDDWPDILRVMAVEKARLMVDHFGLPSGLTCPGIEALEGHAPDRLSLKLSGPYRQMTPDFVPAARRLVEQDPPITLLWGSDWPWTQHEGRHSYQDCIDWLGDWTVPEERAAIAAAGPALGFPQQ